MRIREIFDEIANESSTNLKMAILGKYKDNELFVRVLYAACSKRVKYYIKQIPLYEKSSTTFDLDWALKQLPALSRREFTGYAAHKYLMDILTHLQSDDAYIIERIIDKDCKIGIGTRNINKVIPDLIEKTGYMGCKSFSKDLILKMLAKGDCVSQEKMDGRYMNCIIQGGELQNESRQGEPTILENPLFFSELVVLKDCVLNGELTMHNISRFESNGIISSLISIAEKKLAGKDVTKEVAKFESRHMDYYEALKLVTFTTWDILTVEEYFTRKCSRKYRVRLAELRETLKDSKMISIVETRPMKTLGDAMTHFYDVVSRNGEGVVAKSLDGVWVDSKPVYQVKVKKEINLDLRIVGFKYGTGKNSKWISSVEVISEDGLLKTSPTGLDEDEMEYVTEHQEEMMNSILEIKCCGLSQDNKGNYSVLHPVYKLRRTDKDTANTLAECIEIEASTTFE